MTLTTLALVIGAASLVGVLAGLVLYHILSSVSQKRSDERKRRSAERWYRIMTAPEFIELRKCVARNLEKDRRAVIDALWGGQAKP